MKDILTEFMNEWLNNTASSCHQRKTQHWLSSSLATLLILLSTHLGNYASAQTPTYTLAWTNSAAASITFSSTSSYSDVAGTLTVNNLPDDRTILVDAREHKGETQVNHVFRFVGPLSSSHEKLGNAEVAPAEDYMMLEDLPAAQHLTYGSWFVQSRFEQSTGTNMILFHPSAAGIRDNLNAGETVTSTLEFQVADRTSGYMLLEKISISVTISRPASTATVALAWNTGQSGNIRVDGTSSSYPDIAGTMTVTNTSSSSTIASKVNDAFDGATSLKRANFLADSSNTIQSVSGFPASSTIRAFPAFRHFGLVGEAGDGSFGTWFVEESDGTNIGTRILFKPEPITIHRILDPGESGTSTLTITVDGAASATLVVTLTRPPLLSITTASATVSEGTNISFTISIETEDALASNLPVMLSTMGSTSNYFNTISSISFNMGATDSSKSGTVTTHMPSTMNGDGIIVVTISSSTGYLIDSDQASIRVVVIDTQSTRPQFGFTSSTASVDENATAGNIVIEVGTSTSYSQRITATYTLHHTTTIAADFEGATSGTVESTLNSGQNRGMITIAIENDKINEPNETFTVVLTNISANAEASTTTITVTLNDDEAPPTIRIRDPFLNVPEKSLIEGQSITFTVGVPTDQPATERSSFDIFIRYTITESAQSDFLLAADEGENTVELEDLQHISENFTINTQDDTLDDGDSGTITVTLLPDIANTPPHYVLSTDSVRETVYSFAVHDNDDPPVVKLEADKNSITESDTVALTFEITTAGMETTTGSTAPIDVHYTVTETNGMNSDFVAPENEGMKTAQIAPKMGSVIVNWTPDGDTVDEGAPGTVTITLVADSSPVTYTLTTNATEKTSHVITVMDDDDPPVIKITTNFRDDPNDENSQLMTAQEGDTVNFKLSADTSGQNKTTASLVPINIQVSISQSYTTQSDPTNFIMNHSPTRMIILPAMATSVAFSVEIAQDMMNEDDGTFTVTVNEDPNAGSGGTPAAVYTLSSMKTITVNFEDNDIPVVSFANTPTSVNESANNAIFHITANPAPWRVLTINFTVVDEHHTNKVISPNYVKPATLEINTTGMLTHLVPLINDQEPNDSGSIKFTINENMGVYNLGVLHILTIAVHDDDAAYTRPIISVTTPANSVVEGMLVVFNFTANPAPPTPNFMVDVTVSSTGGSVIEPSELGNKPVEVNLNGNGTLRVSTTDNPMTVAGGTITVVINPHVSDAYRSAPDQRPVTVTVNLKPRVSIAPPIDTVIEGQEAEFRISLNPAPTEELRVKFNVTQTEDAVHFIPPRSVIIAAGSTSRPYRLATNENADLNTRGTITVTIVPDPSYHIAGGMTSPTASAELTLTKINTPMVNSNRYSIASLAMEQILGRPQNQGSSAPIPAFVQSDESETRPWISDTESVPILSISANSNVVDEGDFVQFQITSSHRVAENIGINVSIATLNESLRDERLSLVSLNAGQTSVDVMVKSKDDELAGSDKTISLEILAGPNYAVNPDNNMSTVTVSDASDRKDHGIQLENANRTVNGELMGLQSAQVTIATTNRIAQVFEQGQQNSLALGNVGSIPALVELSGKSLNGDSLDLQSLLDDTSFAVGLFPDSMNPNRTTLWGRGDFQVMSDIQDTSPSNWAGKVFTGQLGIDATVGENLLLGLVSSNFQSEFEHETDEGSSLTLHNQSTTLHPYLGLNSTTDESQFHASVGIGVSETTIEQADYSPKILSGRNFNVGLGGKQQIFTKGSNEDGITELNLTGKTLVAGQLTEELPGLIPENWTKIGHSRLALEASHNQFIFNSLQSNSSAMLGLKYVQKVNQTFKGVELAGNSSLNLPMGLDVTGSSSVLMSSLNHTHQWEVSMMTDYDTHNDNLGVMMTFNPVWGGVEDTDSNSNWFESLVNDQFGESPRTIGTRIESELGYGFNIGTETDRLTPYGGVEYASRSHRKYRIGLRLNLGSNFNFELGFAESNSFASGTSHELTTNGSLYW